jgi:hypothetical protein
MPPSMLPARPLRTARGFASLQLVVASALVLVLVTMFANLLVNLYARGAVRGALDEGARAGALVGAGVEACEVRAREAARSLLAGPLGDRVEITCEEAGGWVVARADVRLPGWSPLLARDWQLSLEGVARREPEP